MSYIKEAHMVRFVRGKFKEKEQFVYCKLKSAGSGQRPEIHVFTEGHTSTPSTVIKVKSFAAVCVCDQVPKIVKARYDNYIYISSDGGATTYIRTDTREERDEWCDELQTFFDRSSKTKANPYSDQPSESASMAPPPLPAHRQRTHTDSTSNRPPISRGRRTGTTLTAPGTMQGTFHAELRRRIEQNRPGDHTDHDHHHDHHDDNGHNCCPRHHIEGGADESVYENVHTIQDSAQWRRETQKSKSALKDNAELYNDFHLVGSLQSHPEEASLEAAGGELYENARQDSQFRSPGWSSRGYYQPPRSLHSSDAPSAGSSRTPVESSWPPSPPGKRYTNEDADVTSYEDNYDDLLPPPPPPSSGHGQEIPPFMEDDFLPPPPPPPEQPRAQAPLDPSFQKKLASMILAQQKPPIQVREPEASMCTGEKEVEEEEEVVHEQQDVYQNIVVANRKPKASSALCKRSESAKELREQQRPLPKFPPRKQSLPGTGLSIPPRLPGRNASSKAVDHPAPPQLPGRNASQKVGDQPSPPRLPARNACMKASDQPAPPQLPDRNPSLKAVDQTAKLRREKLQESVEVRVKKATLTRNRLLLRQKHDSILITEVPPDLRKCFRVGDQLLKVNDQLLPSVESAYECISMSDRADVVITVKRIPYGIICNFRFLSRNWQDIGLELNGREIVDVRQHGLAYSQGHLQSRDIASMSTPGIRVHYAITEVNFEPIEHDAQTEQVQDMMLQAGTEIILILHPVDFYELQLGEEDDLYEAFE